MSATSAAATGVNSQDPVGRIDVDRWCRNIRAETFANYHYHMGVALDAGGEVEASLAAFSRSIEACPWFHQAYYRLHDSLNRLGRADEARTVRARALETDPASERLALIAMAQEELDRQHPADALTLLQRIEKTWPDSASELRDLHLAIARGFAGLKRRDEAESLYQQVLHRWPDSAEAHIYLAETAEGEGAVDKALDHFSQAARLRPDDHPLYDKLNWMLLVNGCYEDAVDLCEQAIRQWPDDAYFLAYSGVGRHLLGRTGEAVERLRRAMTEGADPFSVSRPLLALTLLAADRPEEAVEVAAEGACQAADRPLSRAAYSICLYGAGRTKEALAEAGHATGLPGQILLAHFARAQALLELGHREEAETAVAKGIAAEPGTLGYYMALVRWPTELVEMVSASGA